MLGLLGWALAGALVGGLIVLLCASDLIKYALENTKNFDYSDVEEDTVLEIKSKYKRNDVYHTGYKLYNEDSPNEILGKGTVKSEDVDSDIYVGKRFYVEDYE